MVLGNQEKVSILTAALTARYRALEAIRARTQGVCLWSLGLALAAAGWIVQSGVVLASDQAAVLAIGALAAWFVLRLVFVAGLGGSFRAQQKVAAGLEDLLGFYAPGRFGPDSEPVFPAAWLAAGAKKSGGVLFQSTRPLLDVGAIMLLVSIASRSDWVRAWTAQLLRSVGL